MIKSIYIIRNKINDKVYVGQAIDPHRRFIQHLCNGNRQLDQLPIHCAISKYGKENFYYEILERDITNFNERECYWIQYFDSICPNGYNVSAGGEGFSCGRGKSTRSSITLEIADSILEDLENTSLTQRAIANKYGTSERVVNTINKGETWRDENKNYPIREKFAHFSRVTELEIIWLLKNSAASFQSIANYYNLTKGEINQINQGKIRSRIDEDYPLRKVDGKQLDIKQVFEEWHKNESIVK